MLKKVFVLCLLAMVVISCKDEHPNNYMSISGKFENLDAKDSIMWITGFAVRKKIKVNKDGTFQDSLVITKQEYHNMTFAGQRAIVWLKNGYDISLKGSKINFFRSFEFNGNNEAAHSNQMIVDQYNYGQTAGRVKGFMILDKDPFLYKVEKFRKGMDSIGKLYPKADAKLVELAKKQNEQFFKTLTDNYENAHEIFVKEEKAMQRLKEGNPAPLFKDFENYKGGKNSLSDYRGKYVYIDVWATWCRPCHIQFPYLKKLQERFKDKNIEFLSISTDDDRQSGGSWTEARKRWKQMIKDKNLGGTHLWAGQQLEQLHEDYWIKGIPHFILIDPNGNLIDYRARRPSDPEIGDLLEGYLQ